LAINVGLQEMEGQHRESVVDSTITTAIRMMFGGES